MAFRTRHTKFHIPHGYDYVYRALPSSPCKVVFFTIPGIGFCTINWSLKNGSVG